MTNRIITVTRTHTTHTAYVFNYFAVHVCVCLCDFCLFILEFNGNPSFVVFITIVFPMKFNHNETHYFIYLIQTHSSFQHILTPSVKMQWLLLLLRRRANFMCEWFDIVCVSSHNLVFDSSKLEMLTLVLCLCCVVMLNSVENIKMITSLVYFGILNRIVKWKIRKRWRMFRVELSIKGNWIIFFEVSALPPVNWDCSEKIAEKRSKRHTSKRKLHLNYGNMKMFWGSLEPRVKLSDYFRSVLFCSSFLFRFFIWFFWFAIWKVIFFRFR